MAILLINLMFSVLAAFLSWRRNVNTVRGLRILFAVLAFIFGFLYLIYYAISIPFLGF